MGTYTVPEHIRAMKPKGGRTMVKAIGGNYYVYEYGAVKDDMGRWRTKMGPCIGKIVENEGFIPNENDKDRYPATHAASGDESELCRLRSRVDDLEARLAYLEEALALLLGEEHAG